MKRFSRLIALFAAVCTVVSGVPVTATELANDGIATDEEAVLSPVSEEPSDDGYTLMWEENFDGSALNEEDWNVELHPAGWVNSELQSYVNSDENIKVEDGVLKLIPKQTVVDNSAAAAEPLGAHTVDIYDVVITAEGSDENLVEAGDFIAGEWSTEGWTKGIANWGSEGATADAEVTYNEGHFLYSIDSIGNKDWHIQHKHGLNLEADTTYNVSFKVVSSADRAVVTGVQNNSVYSQYSNTKLILNKDEEKEVSYSFTTTDADDNAGFYVSMGVIADPRAELFANADFSNGKEAWEETIANWEGGPGADASSETGDGAITYTISNAGNEDWNVQLKHNVALKEGPYTVSFDIVSSIDRDFKTGVQSADYKQYGIIDTYSSGDSLKASESKHISVPFKMDTADDTATFYISLGNNGTEYEAHTVTISNVTFNAVGYEYTSGRINTQGKHAFTYGKFEVSAKVPAGKGYLPAFWLMPENEDLYGQWPKCGEIDCMEVMGQETDKVYGTIHFGEPHKESQGTYVLSEEDGADFAEDFHTYTCEWEPGKITWFVDGKKYHEETRWFTAKEGQGTVTYPAPFDQPFYVILNLAVGGSWVGYPEDISFEANPFVVDYVKVYQKDGYNDDIDEPEELPVEERLADEEGNLIINGRFNEEVLTDEADWVFKTAAGGSAEATIADNQITIDTTEAGSELHSVQLYQSNVPMKKGASYEVAFKAKASEARTMDVDVKAPDNGWKCYMDIENPDLTTEWQEFKYTFTMNDKTDLNGRLEFNMGNKGSTATIEIKDVSVKMITGPSEEPTDVKKMLSNGNYIYNGNFQEGAKYLGYWDVIMGSAESAKVTSLSDGRRLEVVMPETVGVPFSISQSGLAFESGKKYIASFSASADKDTKVDFSVGGRTRTIDIIAGDGSAKDYSFNIPASARFSSKDVKLTVSDPAVTVKIDNVSLMEDMLLKNGTFDNGMAGFSLYKADIAKCSSVIDSQTYDNAFDMTIDDTGNADWNIQLMQYVNLEQGKSYRLSYDALSTIDRQIFAQIQRDPSTKDSDPDDYTNYADTEPVTLSSEFQTFTKEFTMTRDTDPTAKFNICFGAVGGTRIKEQHRVVIDNIVLEEITEVTPGEDPGTDTEPAEVVLELPDYTYTGAQIKPVVTVYDGDKLLKLGTDYTVTYGNNIAVNTTRKTNTGIGEEFNEELPYAKITGINNYSGDTYVNFNIVHAAIANRAGSEMSGVVLAYNGQLNQNKREVQSVFKSLKIGKKTLVKDTDYTVSLNKIEETGEETPVESLKIAKNETGKFVLRVTGINNYTGTIVKNVYVAPNKNIIANAAITLGAKAKNVAFTGKNITLTPAYYDAAKRKYYKIVDGEKTEEELKAADVFTVKLGGESLIYGSDFTVSYINNRSVGTATMTIKGVEDNGYFGTKSVNFKIVGKAFDAKKIKISGLGSRTYTGAPITLSDVRIDYKLGGGKFKPLIAGSDYTVAFKKNVNVGTATVIYTGKPSAGLTGKVTKTFKIVPEDIKNVTNNTVTDITATCRKTGAVISDDIELVSAIGTPLVEGKDYKVKYSNNKKVAASDATNAPTAVIEGIKNYKGKLAAIEFTTEAASVDSLDIIVAPVQFNSAKADTFKYKPAVKVLDHGKALDLKKDVTVTYYNNSQADIKAYRDGDAEKKPYVEVKAKAAIYEGEDTADIDCFNTLLTKKNTRILVESAKYTGSQLTPAVAVYYAPTKAIFDKGAGKTTAEDLEAAGFVLVPAEEYDVTYGVNVFFGAKSGSVTVTGKNVEYGGTVSTKFAIGPKGITE